MGRAKLALNAFVKYLAGALLMGAPLFLAANSVHYRGAWLLLGLLFVPMFILGVGLLIFSPELLMRRLNSKEKRKKQSGIVRLSGLSFIVGFVVAGLDYRFGWSIMTNEVVAVSSAILLLAYIGYMEVMRENIWLSRTVEVAENQKVIDTGLYSVVRHPMYLFTLLLFLSMPFILGSWWALIPFAINIPVIVVRTLDEERLLKAELEGYADYCTRVKWRILPFVW